MIETKFIEQYGEVKMLAHNTEMYEDELRFALCLLERWGMVAAMPDGEDSAGRSKLKLSPPTELVDRAFEVASIAFKRAREIGLMHNCGPFPEVSDKT